MIFSDKTITINRELSELDIFTLEFIKILKKHSPYVIISGYVSILLGRARSSEDIDILIPRINFEHFRTLIHELNKAGYYCLNADADKNIYEYITDKTAIRFAKQNTVIPNVELKCAKNKIDDLTLAKTLTVKIPENNELIISHLEMQIAFKEQVLKSPKDLEDARHIRNIAQGHLDQNLIHEYEKMLYGF